VIQLKEVFREIRELLYTVVHMLGDIR
jgi:hypothetical protein